MQSNTIARLITTVLGLGISLLSGYPVSADSVEDWKRMRRQEPRGYVCYEAKTAIVIDGKPDEDAWKAAPWTDDFIDIEGRSKPRPRFRTRAKMLWDADYFYISAVMEEPHVWGTLTEHDSVIFHDNDFEVFIDPNSDNHEYYEFEMNTLNTGWDLFLPKPYKDGGKADNSWEIPGLKTAVAIDGTLNDPSDTDKGWSVEIAIPWKVLAEFAHQPSPPRHGDQWRVSFSRVEWYHDVKNGRYEKRPGLREDNWVWSPQGIIDMHRPERWGFVQFSTAKPGEDRFMTDRDALYRDQLMTVYHHQKAFHKRNSRWAAHLDVLGLSDLKSKIELNITPDGFEAYAPSARPGHRLQVRQDSRLRLVETVSSP